MLIKLNLGRLAFLFIGISALGLPGLVSAEETTDHALVFHGTAHDMLYDVTFDGKNGLAVGNFGLIVETADGGVTWSAEEGVPTDLALLAVVRSGDHCIAAGQAGTVLVSSDCKHWTLGHLAGEPRILNMALTASGTAYAVGGFGTVLKSTDWGKSWSPLTIDWSKITEDGAQPHLYRVHVGSDGGLTIVGEFGLVLTSGDAGKTWAVRHKGMDSLFALAIAPNGDIYAAGQEGAMIKSHDHGTTWTDLDSGTKTVLTSVIALPDGRLVASGIHTVLYSDDAGKTWRADATNRVKLGWDQEVAYGGEVSGHPNVVVVGSDATITSIPMQ